MMNEGARVPFGDAKKFKKSTNSLSEQEVKDLRVVFDVFDADSNGYIDRYELKRAMRSLGFKVTSKTLEMFFKPERSTGGINILFLLINTVDHKSMINAVDLDGSGSIDFEEFLQVIINKQGSSRDLHAEMAGGFQLMDKDNDGYISLQDLKAVCAEVSEGFSEQDLQGMIEEADRDGDGLVNMEEFVQVMLKTNLFA